MVTDDTTTILLDVDGVLHAFGTDAVSGAGYVRWEAQEVFLFRPLLVDALAPCPDVRIVISSSWRFICSEAELRDRLLGPVLASRFAGVTGEEQLSRLEEIQEYVDMRELTRWIALDDDASVRDAESEYPDNLVWCTPEGGISNATSLMRFKRLLALHGRETR